WLRHRRRPSAEHPRRLHRLAADPAAPGAGLGHRQRLRRGDAAQADLRRLHGPARRRADAQGLVAQPGGADPAQLFPHQPRYRDRRVDRPPAPARQAGGLKPAPPTEKGNPGLRRAFPLPGGRTYSAAAAEIGVAVRDDGQTLKGWWRNRVARILLTFFLTSLGTAIVVWTGGLRMLGKLVG